MNNQVTNNANKHPDSRSGNPLRGRIIFLLIVAVFVIPLLAAWWLYRHTETGNPWATSNHGDLINPAYPLESFNIDSENNESYSLENLHGKWTLLFIPPRSCDEACKKNIYHMRQVWVGLGRESPRVQRFLVLQDERYKQQLDDFLVNYPDMQVAFDETGQLISQIQSQRSAVTSNIFLIDPLGNLMMAFPETLDPRDMLKDIKKLLKISTLG